MPFEFQRRFTTGLLTRRTGEPQSPGALGFEIHARNSRLSLCMALEDAFSITRRLVGPDFFGAMAESFVTTHPPRHGWLSAYGEGFPEFIATYRPADVLPYLSHVAEIEWARVRAANLPDGPGLDLKGLAEVAPDILEGLHLSLHRAATLVCSPYPVFDIWQSHQRAADEQLSPIDLAKGGQNVLVSRPGTFAVGVALLGDGDSALVAALADCISFGAASQAAVLVDSNYDLGLRLGDLVALKAFAPLGA
jgi:hypothetical protein